MKKIIFLTIILISFYFTSCINKGQSLNENEILLDYSKGTTKWTSNKELQKWHFQYLEDSINFSYDGENGKEPYQYVDFKLEEIKHLIWIMETKTNEVYGTNNHPELGLRVYYAQKEDTINTVVLSPIFKEEGSGNQLFNPGSSIHTGTFTPWNIRGQLGSLLKGPNPRNMMMLYFQNGNEDGTNLNHGSGCPEKCE